VLNRTNNNYAQGTGSATGRTFVYSSWSVEESWDLGGTAYPTVTNAYQYGDPTQISVTNSAGAGKTTVTEHWPANTPAAATGYWGGSKKPVLPAPRRSLDRVQLVASKKAYKL